MVIPKDLEASLGSRPGGVFYLHGADEHRKEEAARALVAAHLDPGTRDFNLDVLRGGETNVETLASVIGTPPMMAPWRVVMVREVQAMAGSPRARDLLVATAADPPPGLALVLLATLPERSSARFYQELARRARALEFRPLDPDDVPGWLMTHARTQNDRVLEEPAARALAQALGSNLGVLARELDKLSAAVDEGRPITLAEVEASGARLPRQDRWEWFDLVGGKRFREALEGLPVLLDHGETGVGLALGLGTHLLRLGVLVDGGTRALAEVLPPHQRWLARRYSGQGALWGVEEVERAVLGLLRVDRLLKASGLSDRHLLESWLLERAAAQERAA